MGAWGHGSFDNDDAGDWMDDLLEAENTELIREAIAAALEAGDDYIEAGEASAAVAAAEVVAALLGRPSPTLPDEVKAWVAGKKSPSAALVRKAEAAVKLILKSSELRELWAETELSAAWQGEMADLLQRLAPQGG